MARVNQFVCDGEDCQCCINDGTCAEERVVIRIRAGVIGLDPVAVEKMSPLIQRIMNAEAAQLEFCAHCFASLIGESNNFGPEDHTHETTPTEPEEQGESSEA